MLNCYIQDKIGSGFDISAAIFGSHIFKRYADTQSLTEIVDMIKNGEDPNPAIQSLISAWKYNPDPFSLPENLGLCLVDVNSGSDTRVLVKKVLAWDKENSSDGQFSSEMFKNLKIANKNLREMLSSPIVQDDEMTKIQI